MAAVSTSLLLSTWISTSFSTVYQTSVPVIATTQTSIASQFSTATHISSITQPEVVMASTVAVPVIITDTLTNIWTAPSVTATAIATVTAPTVTETIVSTISQPYQTLTYYPLVPTTTVQVTTQFPPASTIVTISPTVTVTEIVFYLENGGGDIYSTISTTLPAQTSAVVIVPGHTEDHGHGWNSWSDAQKGGLIAGVILATLLLALLAWLVIWCMQRRNVWVAGEWQTSPPAPMHQPGTLVIPQAYWGGQNYRI